ncbi:MAG: M48 family metalloprotease [Porticoccaceae bacterium]
MVSYPSRPALVLLGILALISTWASASDIKLPLLGDSTSGVVSGRQEGELGQLWLQMFRSRVPDFSEPQLQYYLEQLLANLATYSELEDQRLELVTVNNPTMNAFAVPGGVVGVHTGLFAFAENENQLASVLSHELAHLSQRHFARSLERQRANAIPTYAGLLTGLILAATVGGDAGIAAITATQAASIQNSLRYSRENEQEADRQGMETMVRADRDPGAVASMFERMLATTRYTGRKPPEYLLTHPLSEQRIADARNRLHKYPSRQYADNIEYHLMRTRALIALDKNPQTSMNRFRSELDGHSLSPPASRYGLALAQSAAGQSEQAAATLAPLLTDEPRRLTYQLAAVTLDRRAGHYEQALTRINALAPSYPGNYPVQMELAETLLKADRYGESERVLENLAKQRPTDPIVWYQLAETSGLAGNIPMVHKARAEYFLLMGIFDRAREHLGYAQKLVRQDFKQSAIIAQRLREIAAMEQRAKQFKL